MRVRKGERGFRVLRLPPLRELSSLIARARAGLEYSADTPWEELSVELAAATVRVERGISSRAENAPPSAIARVTRSVRAIERRPDGALGLGSLAREAGLSPYHFLRTFERLTGITPHQYVRRARLRDAASRLAAEREKVLDIAYDCGFGDVSNFNRAFRNEFGVSPKNFRQLQGPFRRHTDSDLAIAPEPHLPRNEAKIARSKKKKQERQQGMPHDEHLSLRPVLVGEVKEVHQNARSPVKANEAGQS